MSSYDVSAYNKYQPLPDLSYNILEHLMKDPKAEIIWKLLKYNDTDAYAHDNLTKDEKASLICDGTEHEDKFSVFFDPMMDDAVVDMKTFLRIYPSTTYPRNRTTGIQGINFEVFVHSKINHLSNYKTRLDMIIQALIEVLNGINIGGLGVLFFDARASSYDKIILTGLKPYKGKVLTMSVNIG